MNTSVNQVHLVGSLTQMPAVMTNSNGDKMARFAISTKEYRPGIEGKIETKNQWHKLIARNKMGNDFRRVCRKRSANCHRRTPLL